MGFAVSMGTANASPSMVAPLLVVPLDLALTMPMSSPLFRNSAPPELPLLMAALV